MPNQAGGSLYLAMGYDAGGNIVQRGTQRFVFDVGNRMSSAVGKAEYVHDGAGRRARSFNADGSVAGYAYTLDGKLRIGGHTVHGNTWFFYLGDRVVAEFNDRSGVHYVHTDALGSPVARTNAARQVTSRTIYEPYGSVANGTIPPGTFTSFTGHLTDASTGLVYMQQRYYDPIAGRLLSVDPVTTNSGSGGKFNRYAYAENSPYKYVDPDGRDSVVVGNRVEIRPVDSTVPRVSIPNNVGAVGVSSSSMTFHTYDVRTASSLTNSSAVGAGIARSPTPGPGNSPASPGGTRNNAGSIPMNGSSNMVNSFSVASPDPSKFTNITVNYTISGQHGLSEGFVVRFGEIGANGAITLRSYGEGNNWQQAPALKGVWGPMVEKTWDTNQKEIIKNAEK